MRPQNSANSEDGDDLICSRPAAMAMRGPLGDPSGQRHLRSGRSWWSSRYASRQCLYVHELGLSRACMALSLVSAGMDAIVSWLNESSTAQW